METPESNNNLQRPGTQKQAFRFIILVGAVGALVFLSSGGARRQLDGLSDGLTESTKNTGSSAAAGVQVMQKVWNETVAKNTGSSAAAGVQVVHKVLNETVARSCAELLEPKSKNHTPLFWHNPKAGGTTIENMYYVCRGMVITNQVGGNKKLVPAWNATTLSVHSPWRVNGVDVSVVNVDTSTVKGIARAKKMGLAESGLAEVVFSPLIHPAVTMFSPQHKARLFAMFRHPIDREASRFYYLQDADWEEQYSPETKNWTARQWTNTTLFVPDWTVRGLVKKGGRQVLTDDDLQSAKELLRTRVLVGLTSKMKESVERFDEFFGFVYNNDKARRCSEDLLNGKGKGSNKHSHPRLVPGSDDWQAFAEGNYWDLKLYDYICELYQEQGKLFGNGTTNV